MKQKAEIRRQKAEIRKQKLESRNMPPQPPVSHFCHEVPVIPSEARNLALAFLGQPARRRARFLASLGMTRSLHGFWVALAA
jgi:Tfp pilus assembly protein PilN